MADWRLRGQEKYLKGATLSKQKYTAYREGWDHDHCAFCWAKFSEREGDLAEGYATSDRYRWICEACFKDFKSTFQWDVADSETD